MYKFVTLVALLALCSTDVSAAKEGRQPRVRPSPPVNEDEKSGNILAPSTLVLTSVLFRHGDRVPASNPQEYTGNPYKNHSFFPYNYGGLTLKGQKTAFESGVKLRRRYRNFLGDLYFTDLVDATSSSIQRCQMSLQALTAGLFATTTNNPIPGWQWQSVPYSIIPGGIDKYITVPLICPKIFSHFGTVGEVDPTMQRVIDLVQEYSGYENVGFWEVLTVYDWTKTSLENGLKVPEWLKRIYPTPMRSVTVEGWRRWSILYHRLMVGPLLKRIIENSVAKARGELEPETRKMFLFSGHDMNIYAMLVALDVWPNEEILYGASLRFELHKLGTQYGFKIYLENQYPTPRLLWIPDCGFFCPLEKFIDLTQNLYEPEPTCD